MKPEMGITRCYK